MFVAAIFASLLRLFTVHLPPMSTPILLVLGGPTLLGLGIIAISLGALLLHRNSGLNDAKTLAKFKSLTGVGVLATLPLLIYVIYCFQA